MPEFRQKLREENSSLATLNGAFDLLHPGHLFILLEAAKQADILLVALNSDSSIRQYKHKDPIIPLEQRLEMMAAIEYVDYVTFFPETTPVQLLEVLQPEVHINCEEYGVNCIEAEVVKKHGGRLHLVERIPGLATSQIIKKIKSLCD